MIQQQVLRLDVPVDCGPRVAVGPYVSHISKLVRATGDGLKKKVFSKWPQKVLEMCPRAPQTSPIDRKWKVGTIYNGFMLRWLDRLAIGEENGRSASGEAVEQM